MRRVAIVAAAVVFAAIGFTSACVSMSDIYRPQYTAGELPDIGTKMPDGRVYAGLSMDSGKPSFIAPAGGRLADGTVYAGISPDTNKELYTTEQTLPASIPGTRQASIAGLCWPRAIMTGACPP